MLECPSCRQVLPLNAHFCAHCGVRLPAITPSSAVTGDASSKESASDQPVQSSLADISARETLIQPGFFRQAREASNAQEPKHSKVPVSADSIQALTLAEYAPLKHELAGQCLSIIASMDSLLPFVYENHRAENQALFTSTLEQRLPLENPIWGRVAFVLGAYGNYMYRYALNAEQKQQVWNALLWSVYYERCYRRKYLAQRCQQLLHFFQGCAEDGVFCSAVLNDLEALSLYLEANSLKKMQEALQQLPNPPASLLQHVTVQMPIAEARKQERQVLLQAQITRKGRKAGAKKETPITLPGGVQMQQEQGQPPAPFDNWQTEDLESRDEAVQAPASDEISLVFSASAVPPAAHKFLAFFTDEQYQDFFTCLRTARLESINRLLQQVRRPLLVALCQELLAAGPLDNQAPRRPIRLGKKNADRFVEARRLLSSPRPHEQQMGLRLFEQGARDTTHPDYAPLAREWMLYARAVVQGSPRVIDQWESDLQRTMASWEECWNLALFYQQTGYPAEALRVLKPGLDALRAPVAHLRLALACALDLLLRPEAPGAHTHDFLLAHLERWPHPLSYLAWLALAYDERRPLHPRQQSLRLSTFQDLLEHPVSLLDPQKDLLEVRVAALEEALVEKTRCEEAWFLWVNDYAEHHPRKYQAWARLAETSERLRRLEVAEQALQHIVEIQYHNDYAHYQEGEPLPRARYLRGNLEKLFEFYQRHGLFQPGLESFESCYPSLTHLWDAHDSANCRLIALTRPYLEMRRRAEEEADRTRREVNLRDLSRTVTMPLEHFKPGLRVGIFVDYENIARFIPREMDAEEVGKALVSYASQFGEVVCQWASASPHNLSNLADVRSGLEAAHFKVRFPRRELQFSISKKNLADFALLECLSEAMVTARPDVYLIVSGDRDYYERICSLLDAGHTVRILAAADSQHLSSRYRELEQQRARERGAAGQEELDFFIDDLGEILYPLVSLN